MHTPAALLAALALSTSALAQTSIDPANKFCYAENAGWMNWHDAGTPQGSQAVTVRARIIAGFVWCENLGWLRLGSGYPAAGPTGQYSNLPPDYGVNRDPLTGYLSGFAWGENVGWINFSGGALATNPAPARFDEVSGRFSGFVWGENIGWINLNLATPGQFVASTLSCGSADVGRQGGEAGSDGLLDNNDFVVYIDWFFNANPAADFGSQGGVPGADTILDNNDFVVFIDVFFSGCQ